MDVASRRLGIDPRISVQKTRLNLITAQRTRQIRRQCKGAKTQRRKAFYFLCVFASLRLFPTPVRPEGIPIVHSGLQNQEVSTESGYNKVDWRLPFMFKTISTLTLVTLFIFGAALPCLADENTDATRISDKAIKQLTAFKCKPARSALEASKNDIGSTPAFKVAWGLLLAEEGKLDEGVKNLQQAADADKKDPAADYFRGEVLYWQKNKDAANAAWIQSANRAQALVKKSPEDARANYYLGAALVRQKKYNEARKALGVAKKNGFAAKLVNYQIGLSYAFSQQWQPAKDSFDKVIKADSGFAHAYFYRGMTWKQLKRTDEMMLDLDRFLKLAPNSKEASTARSLIKAGGG